MINQNNIIMSQKRKNEILQFEVSQADELQSEDN